MKKFLFIFLFCLCPLFVAGCTNGNVNSGEPNNANNLNNQQNVYSAICQDMNNVASTLRNLDILYYEDYAINELNPIVGYSTYQNQTENYGVSASTKNIEKDVPASSYVVNDELLDYSYEPKYILDTNSLDTTFLVAYMQSLQDLFLITNDITAGNQILGTITYNVINEALNVKNSAGLANISNLNLTLEQNYIFAECSIGINALLSSIANSSGFIDAELNSITNLRENYYKNIEALNIKYITILNIIDSRIVQLQNLKQLIERLNNQLLIIANSNSNAGNLANNYGLNQNNGNNNILNNDNNLNNNLDNNNFRNNSNSLNGNSNNALNKINPINNNNFLGNNNTIANNQINQNSLNNNLPNDRNNFANNNLINNSNNSNNSNANNNVIFGQNSNDDLVESPLLEEDELEYQSYLQKNKIY